MAQINTPRIQEPPKKDVDKQEQPVKDLPQTEEEPVAPRTRADLLCLRRQLRGTLEYIELTLRKQGIKV